MVDKIEISEDEVQEVIESDNVRGLAEDLIRVREKLEEICLACGVFEDEPELALEIINGLNTENLNVRKELCILKTQLNNIREVGIELSIMNTSLLKHEGDLSEKSLKNFTAEIRRLTDAILQFFPSSEDEEK